MRTSVFPVEPNGEQQVQFTYEHLLKADGDRIDYELPRSQSVAYDTPWEVDVEIKSNRSINAVYSPSHQIETIKKGNKRRSVRISEIAKLDPGAFRLSYLLRRGAVTASLFSYPDADRSGGCFLLLAGTSDENASSDKPAPKRELTLVIDRSGSMRGAKIAQAKDAALSVLEGLLEGESFNVIVYNDAVEAFAPVAVEKTDETLAAAKAFVQGIKANGGTNLHDALVESLRRRPRRGVLPIVLFMTDGLPTVGVRSEQAIRDVATEANIHSRRVFTFGVGFDVNTPLLDKIALNTRAFATFVFPGEDVEVKVSRVFDGLDGPILASPELVAVNSKGHLDAGRISDLLPGRLPDLFDGDQLVLLGRYTGKAPLRFMLKGERSGEAKSFQFNFDTSEGGVRNAFVGRLWATRKIAGLTDAIRDMGAVAANPKSNDPRLKELSDEIIRLSTDFGILTEYTSFLATEGTDLASEEKLLEQSISNYQARAIGTRSGIASVNQDLNNGLQRMAACEKFRNCFFDANLNRVAITNVQQATDNAFYRRNGRWIDSRLVNQDTAEHDAARVIKFGSPEFVDLAWTLARRGRQASVSLDGDILLEVDGESILIKHDEVAQSD
ncbi:MAG: VWA domain-containing protein [Planctomycetes bacterium]|nr:VWA domain-containing protein [Planctomycetota bacterium]